MVDIDHLYRVKIVFDDYYHDKGSIIQDAIQQKI